MKIYALSLFYFLSLQNTWSQENPIQGNVLDAKTKQPLSYATIKVKAQDLEFFTSTDGKFEIPVSGNSDDSLEISFIGYKTFKKRVGDLKSPLTVSLEEFPIQLKAVTVVSRRLNLKEVDNSLRVIKGPLYAYESETTNGLYNLFLSSLEEQGQLELLKQCDYDLSVHNAADKLFYKDYTAPYKAPLSKTDTLAKDYTNYPAVNISHGAAGVFCKWLTEQYNSNSGKKKFKRVKFRLPTLNEWQIAALGYPKFQSWNLEENKVEVVIPNDTLSEIKKGVKTAITVDHDILYPWWNHYNYRRKVTNNRNCYLGNFNITPNSIHCLPVRPGLDGWTRMASTTSYFPNDMGLYDVVGNVAEMIDEKGKACGGSWNELPKESTIHSVKLYKRPDATIGFRIFMDVIEE